MAAGSIIIDLLMRTGSFETDSKRAEKAMKQLKDEAKKIGVAIGAAFVVAATSALYLAQSSINLADELYKTSQKAGVTVESLSALGYAADLAGVSHEELGVALVKLSRSMSDTAQGTGDAIRGFTALGISVKNADGTLKSSDQVLKEIAERFARMEDGAEKTAIAVNIFGRSGAQLIPLLNAGATGLEQMRIEAEKLGVVIGTDMAREAEIFNDNLTRMKAGVDGLANSIAGTLLPALNSLYKDFATFGDKMRLSGLAGDVISLDKSLKQLEARKAMPLGWSNAGNIDAEIEKTKAALEKAKAQFRLADTGNPNIGVDNYDLQGKVLTKAPVMKPVKTGGKDMDADFKAYMKNLDMQIQKTQNLTEVEQVLAEVTSGRLSVSAKQQDQLLVLASRIDKEKEVSEQIKLRRELVIAEGDAVMKANEEYQNLMDKLLDDTPSKKLQIQRRDVELLTEAFNSGRISEELYLEAVTARLDLTAEKTKEVESLAKDLGLTFTSAFEEAIAEGKSFSDILKGIGSDLLKLGARKFITEPVGDFLTNMFKGVGGAALTGGWSGGFGTGAGFGNQDFGGFFAAGGDPPVNKVSVVGELGPELFVPRTAGTILPNSALGKSVSVNSNPVIHIDSRTDQAQIMSLVERGVKAGNVNLLNELQISGSRI